MYKLVVVKYNSSWMKNVYNNCVKCSIVFRNRGLDLKKKKYVELTLFWIIYMFAYGGIRMCSSIFGRSVTISLLSTSEFR